MATGRYALFRRLKTRYQNSLNDLLYWYCQGVIRERQWYSLRGFVFPPRFHGFLARDISDLFQCIVNNFPGIAIVGKISAHFLGFVFKVHS